METDKQIDQANEVATIALETTKRIYDLVFTVLETMSEDIAAQLNLKRETSWGRMDSRFINRYGTLSTSEIAVLRRYVYANFTGTKARPLKDNIAPFILFSVATRKFSQKPALIYGILRDIDWGAEQKMEIEPFMYEISERRREGVLEVSRVNVISQKGSAVVEFNSRSLFEITEESVGDITKEIVDWFEERLR